MNRRIFIEKKEKFNTENQNKWLEIQKIFPILTSMKSYLIYDIFNLSEQDKKNAFEQVFANPVTDILHEEQPEIANMKQAVAVEYLPGQYDQRADAAEQCLSLLNIENVQVQTAVLYLFEGVPNESIRTKIARYLINPIECREKELQEIKRCDIPAIRSVPVVQGFCQLSIKELKILYEEYEFSFGFDDLCYVQDYFKTIKRDPTETELKVLDTYWSDHCRHTTFETEIKEIHISSQFKELIQRVLDEYIEIREALGISKPICLMDLATIMGKYFIRNNRIKNIEISEEINACSIEIIVDEGGKEEEWLLMFKNETHNHPTEIEPFGGASTCIGGAIRDPLSGRAYVYQALRLTGAANPLERIEDTLEGKLPQRKITTEAAKGYSAYGNQIGVATTLVKEIYDDGYKAKRMEVGFVVGAVKKKFVRRETPSVGDKIILLGGRTGRDGIGGATGSSKVHDKKSIEDLSAEVQKGNAPVERKIQRLFKREEVLTLIKKCNDFGAGGIAVAVGEIADGVKIDLDKVPIKYKGLNGTELAISESQERMAVVVEADKADIFIRYAAAENLEATVIASVTAEARISMYWRGDKIVDIEREFLNTNGVRKEMNVEIADADQLNPFQEEKVSDGCKKQILDRLADLNGASQQGLAEQFDNCVGRSTVLAPYGGSFQDSPEDVSVQKIPTTGFTQTVSMATFGFNPIIAKWSSYHGGYYAVIDSVTKLVAAGADYRAIRLSFQEYFENLRDQPIRWGKPFAALLGTMAVQKALGVVAIGGKDSMSGSYKNLDVPPTLISFAIAPAQQQVVTSATFQKAESSLYLLRPTITKDYVLDLEEVKNLYDLVPAQRKNILSSKIVEAGGLAETIIKMTFGNEIGVAIETDCPLTTYLPGSIVLELQETSENESFIYLGKTSSKKTIKLNDITLHIAEAKTVWKNTFEPVFPTAKDSNSNDQQIAEVIDGKSENIHFGDAIDRSKEVKVIILVFPGTNSEYDTQKAFEREGASVCQIVVKNIDKQSLKETIRTLLENLEEAHVLCIPGGFSAADEPDGSGKFIASFLRNEEVKQSIHNFLDSNGLVLGICNGFQALVKSGLLPYGRITTTEEDSPILFHNTCKHHISKMVKIKVINDQSPWLKGMKGEVYWVPISHGEGQFIFSENKADQLMPLIATCYVEGYNLNGSMENIEGIVSPCGRIYGRMGHPERMEKGTFKNIPGSSKEMNIFRNAIAFVLEHQRAEK